MTVSAQEDVLVAPRHRRSRSTIDVVKLIVCIGGGVLPWAAIFGAVRLMMAALG